MPDKYKLYTTARMVHEEDRRLIIKQYCKLNGNIVQTCIINIRYSENKLSQHIVEIEKEGFTSNSLCKFFVYIVKSRKENFASLIKKDYF